MEKNDIRSKFLNFFEKNNHKVLPSDSLIPANVDKSILFTNSGMMQFKNYFTGIEKSHFSQIATSQKCLRAGGKHNDLENVGFTNRHHTFFEMLGNFSFGSYFKEQAIYYSWQFLTQELKIDKNKLYFTVYDRDQESFDLWKKITNCNEDRIVKINTDDNFWSMGDTGPCGPCSEIFYDLGENVNIEGGNLFGKVGENDRYIEIWNLVFMQFEKDISLSRENYKKLPQSCVDTGMGLERICAILEGKSDNYEGSFFKTLIENIKEIYNISNKKHQEDKKIFYSLRILADHIRAIAFLIADGILPNKTGRGYVLRRIMRRAMRYAHYLNENDCLIVRIFDSLIAEKSGCNMSNYFTELDKNQNLIKSTILNEEESFKHLLKRGTSILEEETQNCKNNGKNNISGAIAFKLYDTFGFPFDLTKDFARENNMQIDEDEFEKLMQKQQDLAKQNWKGGYGKDDIEKLKKIEEELNRLDIQHSEPLYYKGETLLKNPKIVALIDEDFNLILDKNIDITLERNFEDIHKYKVIFKETVLYPEGGGQESDKGYCCKNSKFFDIKKVSKVNNLILHEGSWRPEKKTESERDFFKKLTKEQFLQQLPEELRGIGLEKVFERRKDNYDNDVLFSHREEAPKNHTATHLLQSALRQVLGSHVVQKGSNVNEEGLRFDFAHNKALTQEELDKVQSLIEEWIPKELNVNQEEISKEEANKKGALCFFEDKYGEKVRVIEVLDKFNNNKPISIEFCGGTHVKNTKEIENFLIIKETSVASGIRRIEAIAGHKASAKYWKKNFDFEKLQKEKAIEKSKELQASLNKKDEEILKYKTISFNENNLDKEYLEFENKILKPLFHLNENEIKIIFTEIQSSLLKKNIVNLIFLDTLEISSDIFRTFCLNFRGQNKNCLIAMIYKKDEKEESIFVNILRNQEANFDCKKIMEILFKERQKSGNLSKSDASKLDNASYKPKFGGIEDNLQGKINLLML